MTNYEHLENLMQHCKDAAAETDDERMRKIHEDNARIFHERALALTLEEAAQEWEGVI